MKCAYCGKENKAGTLVCKRCGIALPVPPPPAGEHDHCEAEGAADPEAAHGQEAPDNGSERLSEGSGSKGRKSPLAAAIAAVIALGALIALLASTLGSGKKTVLPGRNAFSVYGSEGGAALFQNGDEITVPGFELVRAVLSTDGSVACMLAEDGSLFTAGKEGTRAIAKGVQSFVLSVSGAKVVYRDENSLLWSADIKNSTEAPVCICSTPVDEEYAVSPGGETVSYSADNKLYIRNDSVKEAAEGLKAVSVSDGGSFVYAYSPAENALYSVGRRGKAEYIRSNIQGPVYLNRAHDEIVFSIESGEGIVITMCSMRGKEPYEVLNSSSPAYPVMPVSGILKEESAASFEVYTTPFNNFEGRYFAGASLVKYSAKGSSVLEPEECFGAVSSNNSKTVVFINAGKLKKRVSGASASESLAESCTRFLSSTDCRTIWYVDRAGALHCLNGTSDGLITPAVIEDLAITPNGKSAVFTIAGSVFMNKGGAAKNSLAYEGLTAAAVFADGQNLRVLTEKGWEKLPSKGNKIDLTK